MLDCTAKHLYIRASRSHSLSPAAHVNKVHYSRTTGNAGTIPMTFPVHLASRHVIVISSFQNSLFRCCDSNWRESSTIVSSALHHACLCLFLSLSLPPLSFLSLCQCLPLIYTPFPCMRYERLSSVQQDTLAFIH